MVHALLIQCGAHPLDQILLSKFGIHRAFPCDQLENYDPETPFSSIHGYLKPDRPIEQTAFRAVQQITQTAVRHVLIHQKLAVFCGTTAPQLHDVLVSDFSERLDFSTKTVIRKIRTSFLQVMIARVRKLWPSPELFHGNCLAIC
ncbi:SU(VAR)3-9 homolog 9 [Striga asiatica]|uniref:SU(VAR)3-9 homolog 9 n=1 Tax=Striga asiatica TaxID=4170 RepID=A0A5A7Q8P6_STRAF|nr:SU(VAR)3-9 homolog 9 [Striga asiatica]